ncbi:MAG TPA: gliding motility-associated C-terminal domain-containing protein [Saprospiraceae bacterium]|nr:gliding motility-associated C-terminal domain-containing protein [Saprospiraceae bacterium]
MKGIIRSIIGTVLMLLSLSIGYAQKPFDCSGRIYRVIEREGGSALEKINLRPAQSGPEIDFEELHFFADRQLNGICYNPKDNLIYGLEMGARYQLFRLDANYQLTILKELDLPSAFFFVSGDISPDGRYLVLMGFSQKEQHNILVRVNLERADYPTEIRQLVATGNPGIYCADIAYHPTTRVLYGFDHKEGRLVTIDERRGLIDNTSYPLSDGLSGNMPSLFFDARGRLFGIAVPSPRQRSRRFYEFELSSGNFRELAELGEESNQDACSCPFTVNLYQQVSLRRAFPCTDLTFTLRLVNRSPFFQSNLRLRDTLAADLVIEEIVYNPFKGRILSGEGNNILAIDGLDLPIGTDSIVIRVRVPAQSKHGQYASQAYLSNIRMEEDGPLQTRRSDDPQTVIGGDPTRYEITALEVLFAEDFPMLCQGETLKLSPQMEGATAYHWNTGSRAPGIEVAQGGWYEVSVVTDCGTAMGAVYVEQDDLRLEVNPASIEVERGSSVQLSAVVHNDYANSSLFWQPTGGASTPNCLTCTEITITAAQDVLYQVLAVNANGCTDRKEVSIKTSGFHFFAPTAFSPDGNGRNDHFYLFGKFDFDILTFSVYDRWGTRLFHRTAGRANDPDFSWDGSSADQPVSAGVYMWAAQIRLGTGQLKNLSGEVHLIR